MNEISPNSLTTDDVMKALGTLLDPEFGLSIVELGLIYDVQVSDQTIAVSMTLTSPHCPAGQVIHDGMQALLEALPGGREVAIEVTWEPQWTPERISPAAREQLGWPPQNDV
jgi:metal-sulfur cluster biosynthetic enzyme